MYSTGTVTTTANSTKLVGTGTKWLNNINRVSAEQAIQIQIGATVHNNSIQSIQSDTELTLNFPFPTAAKDAKYVILTTMVHSVSDAMNKIVSMNGSNVQFSDILTRWMTEQGIITVTLPDQTTQQLRTTKEMDKQLDGKFDKKGGAIIGTADVLKLRKSDNNAGIYLRYQDAAGVNTGYIGYVSSTASFSIVNQMIGSSLVLAADKTLKFNDINVMKEGDFGFGGNGSGTGLWANWTTAQVQDFFKTGSSSIWRNQQESTLYGARYGASMYVRSNDTFWNMNINHGDAAATITSGLTGSDPSTFKVAKLYSTLNTTKDANGNLKAASPIIKVFADDIELNDESEGVEMEHLGVGHYLIKGVVGFNADGAWGINNGFVIPQGHNGKNMVLIDYEVKPDGNIELFVFHNQNIDMPERFQNKRIKHFDEEGQPIYFDNYEPCDVPESRWIDMRVEMPPNSLYNQKQAEAQRLAEIEAERLAKEEAEHLAEEAERAEQEATVQVEEQ